MLFTDAKITKRLRKYYPQNFDISKWENVEPCLNKILETEVNNADDLIRLRKKYSELLMMISEEQGRRYIKMTCHTDNKEYKKSFNDYYNNVVAKAKPYSNIIDRKFIDSEHRKDLPQDKYQHMQNIVKNRLEVFHEDNVSLETKEQELANAYSEKISQMTACFEGQEYTLAQLNRYLQNNDRSIRERAWKLRYKMMSKETDEFHKLFDELRIIREKQAKNVGFSNYRDYKHKAMGRFSYTPQDVEQFHDSVEKAVLPFLREKTEERKERLHLDSVRPWDTAVSLEGEELVPYQTIDEFLEKAVKVLYQVDPKYGINFNKIKNSELLDVENRKGKSPGGYNYPLRELGSSFIMMNAVGVHRDIVTLLHEAGHAMHSFATKPLYMMDYKECPHESAELASMAMEMLSMDYWNEYYDSKTDLKIAKKNQLIKTLQFLPWCMTIDAFQQWIYTHPDHTAIERDTCFASLVDRFNVGVDWQNLEEEKNLSWMFQLHIFKYPFYYIEYGISQLGALALYKNYREKGKVAINDYDNFMIKGYTKPLDKLYKTAGIKFDFSESYISELVDFVKNEIEKL